ncbi:MAG TPA: alpha/beta hydrolase [Acidimicrobiales bacterium]|nr:alpha/beta hydrolase [Acidimicrobiales bacterium]
MTTNPPPPPARITETVDTGVILSAIPWGLDGALTPILLVHGLASNARMWDGVAADLAERGHPVVAVDQRGHGLSSKPDTGYDFETLSRDLARLIAQLGWETGPPLVAGQSWGGNVVLDLSVRHPESVSGLVLVDGGAIDFSGRFADRATAEAALAPPRLEGTPAAAMDEWFRKNHPDWPESGIQGSLANMEVLGDGTLRPWLSRDHHMQIIGHMWEQHPQDLYPGVGVPVLLLMAEDRSNSRWMAGKRDEAAAAVRALPMATLQWIEGDHDLHAQHPALVARLIHEAAVDAPEAVS